MVDDRQESKKMIAKRIIDARLRTGKKQSHVASEAGISKTSQNLYEQGERVPDAISLQKLARVLNVTSDYLIGLSDVPDRTTKLPDEIARLTRKQRDLLMECDDVVIVSKAELLRLIGEALN